MSVVERRIDLSNLDLDAALGAIKVRESAWETQGFSIDRLTWMDNEADWPRPLLTDRAGAQRPMSLGLMLRRGDGAEVEVVLYAGGWADVATFNPHAGDVWNDYVELESADE